MTPPDPDLDALRRQLAHLRAARGWTYDELAARSGLARRTLIDIEQGRTTGSLKTWHALAHTLNTPLEDLLGTLCREHHPPEPDNGQHPDAKAVTTQQATTPPPRPHPTRPTTP